MNAASISVNTPLISGSIAITGKHVALLLVLVGTAFVVTGLVMLSEKA